MYTQDALEGTTRLLSLNPEFQTGWGVRRRILLNGLLPQAACVPLLPSQSRRLNNTH